VAINIQSETLLSLADAARALPPIDGKRPHCSTIWRWSKKGLHGVYLEYVRLGHRVCTSQEALSRFVNALAAADRLHSVATPMKIKSPSPAARSQAIERANEFLAKNGISNAD